MSSLLLNGCSYASCWRNIDELSNRLGHDNLINLSIPGSSNDRIFRTTFEYLTNFPNVDFVILMLTFFDRQEAPWRRDTIEYEGQWISYTPKGISSTNIESLKLSVTEKNLYSKYIEDRYKFDIKSTYIDKLIVDLVTFTAWLDSIGIGYCVFNSCENLITYSNNQFLTKKLKWVNQNKKIIDLTNFISNEWMYQNGAIITIEERMKFEKIGVTVDPRWAHYGKDGHDMLNNYLYNYITTNCL